MLRIPHQVIFNLVYGIIRRGPYPQRQRAILAREDHLLSLWERTTTAGALQNQFAATVWTRISDQTVRHRLRRLSFVLGGRLECLV